MFKKEDKVNESDFKFIDSIQMLKIL